MAGPYRGCVRTIGRRLLLFVFALAAVLLIDAARAPATAAARQPSLAWSGCGGDFECATLAVPLDYAQPAGRQIDIRLIRLPARKPAQRIGSLLSNPGGPGGSGIEFLRGWWRTLDADIRDRFDLVSFDPRGVGESTPLLCHDDIQRLIALEPEPATADEWAEVRGALREFVDLCAARGGDLLPHLGSLDVVRDMDRIREALGDEKLTYLGYSYGTVLGALYAEEFPGRVRAIVLDAPVDLSLSPDELNITQALGFERALDRFIEDCRERQCVLVRNGRDPAAAIDALRARVRQQPIPAPGADRPAGPGETLLAIVSALYRQTFWPSLAAAVQAALDGDGTWLVQMADGLWGGRVGEYDNSFEMNSAVNCLDYPYSRDPAHYEELAQRGEREAARFGAALGSTGLVCALWPAPPRPVGVPDGAGAPPLLVVGTTGDPATPYEWALAMRRDLVSAVLVTREGEGHTAYAGGNRCVDEIVNVYLLTLALPEDGVICGTDAPPRSPPTPPAAGFPPRTGSSPTAESREPPQLTSPSATGAADGTYWWVWAIVAGAVVVPLLGGVWFVTVLRRR